MTNFDVEVIEIFLAKGSSEPSPLFTHFMWKHDSSYQIDTSLDLAIKDHITFGEFDHNVVPVVADILFPCKVCMLRKTGLHLSWE